MKLVSLYAVTAFLVVYAVLLGKELASGEYKPKYVNSGVCGGLAKHVGEREVFRGIEVTCAGRAGVHYVLIGVDYE